MEIVTFLFISILLQERQNMLAKAIKRLTLTTVMYTSELVFLIVYLLCI